MRTPDFQFTASYEADLFVDVRIQIGIVFQFTASYEADLPETEISAPTSVLSIHSLIRG